jgi:hypothetical protein
VPGVTGDELATAWQRIEHYTAHRWTARTVTWIAEGPGEWRPPLAPATLTSVEVWADDDWTETTPGASPFGGYVFDAVGPYRITATVGAGPVPEAVQAAVQRLATYLASEADTPAGARSYSANVGQLSETITRDAAHMGRAMQNSGAADLLRPYRRA